MISLGSLFSRQPAPLLGLDISSSSVKLVELGRDKAGRLVLERCAIEPLERGWITDGNVEKFDEVAEAMRRVVKKSGTRTRNVAMALPPSAVITKKIILPGGLSEQDLEVQVEAEANQYIPFSLDEVSLDFCVVGPSSTSAGDVEVLIAASRKEKVQDRQGLAEAAGLKPIIVDVDSYASRVAAGRLIQALPNQGIDTMVALFEVGAFTTSMQVIRNDEVLYDRDQAFGGAQLTQLIVRQYGFSAGRGRDQEAQRRPARGLRIRRAQALCREHGPGDRPGPAVLLHQHAAQQGRLRDAGRRLGRAAGPDRRGHHADLLSLQPGQSVRGHGSGRGGA